MKRNFSPDGYCLAIFSVLLFSRCFDEDTGMRFNELEKNVYRYITKISTPTFINHLKELEKLKVIRRVRKGEQNVVYYIKEGFGRRINPEGYIETLRRIEQDSEIIRSWTLREIANYMINLLTLTDFYSIKLALQSCFEPQRITEIRIQNDFVASRFQFIIDKLIAVVQEKTPTLKKEYEETVEDLDRQIEQYQEILFQRANK